jgi:hypothetical protein
MSTNRLVKIEQRIEWIKAQLTGIGDMRPGSLTRQYKNPESRSGPYYQLSYTLDRQSRTSIFVVNRSPTFAAGSATTSASRSSALNGSRSASSTPGWPCSRSHL